MPGPFQCIQGPDDGSTGLTLVFDEEGDQRVHIGISVLSNPEEVEKLGGSFENATVITNTLCGLTIDWTGQSYRESGTLFSYSSVNYWCLSSFDGPQHWPPCRDCTEALR